MIQCRVRGCDEKADRITIFMHRNNNRDLHPVCGEHHYHWQHQTEIMLTGYDHTFESLEAAWPIAAPKPNISFTDFLKTMEN